MNCTCFEANKDLSHNVCVFTMILHQFIKINFHHCQVISLHHLFNSCRFNNVCFWSYEHYNRFLMRIFSAIGKSPCLCSTKEPCACNNCYRLLENTKPHILIVKHTRNALYMLFDCFSGKIASCVDTCSFDWGF